MAEREKPEGALTGKEVEIFLTTPLFRFRYVFNGEERELLENAVRVSGTVTQETAAGLAIHVEVVSNMKRQEEELPFEEIFLPFDKIDFVVVK